MSIYDERTRPRFNWTDDQIPAGWLGSWRVASGKWHQRCRECGLMFESDNVVMRHAGIGPHEVDAHGLEVPGINATTYTDECTLCGHVAHAHHLTALMTMQAIHGFLHTVHRIA